MNSPESEAPTVLVAEDNQADVRLIREAISLCGVRVSLDFVSDGEAVMAYLRREEPYGDAPRPGVIFLDLNMPRKDGREVLAEIKADPDLMRIPVVVLTTSAAEDDVLTSYGVHANCFVTKPPDLDRYMRAIALTAKFWLDTATLPQPAWTAARRA